MPYRRNHAWSNCVRDLDHDATTDPGQRPATAGPVGCAGYAPDEGDAVQCVESAGEDQPLGHRPTHFSARPIVGQVREGLVTADTATSASEISLDLGQRQPDAVNSVDTFHPVVGAGRFTSSGSTLSRGYGRRRG